MTCELITVAVTNAETMLSKAWHKFFSIHKRAFVDMATEWADVEELCLWYKEGGCGERLHITLDSYTT